MKIIVLFILNALFMSGCATPTTTPEDSPMIVHSVFFKLHHDKGSDAEREFLTQAAELASISGVENFQVLAELSPKNNFDFGLSMEFSDQATYDGYNNHPDHVRFVQEVWLKEVAEFQEIDYAQYPTNP